MGRVLVILLIVNYSLFAGWCIQHAMQKRIHGDEDKRFLQRFAKGAICKRGGFYHFISGPYKNQQELEQAFKEAKKLHPDAYMKRCTSLKCTSSTPKKRSYNKPPSSKEAVVKKKVHKLPTELLKQSEDSFIQGVLQQSSQKSSHAYTLTLQQYLKRLLQKDFGLKSSNYEAKAKKLEAILEQSKYNWQLYFNATARYAKFIDYSLITDKELTIDVGVNVDKRLFDKEYTFLHRIRSFKEQLAKIDYLSAKEQLSLLGVAIYSEALLAKELKEIYEKEYFNQKRFFYLIKERARVGVASKVDKIDANNDFLELQKALLEKIYNFSYSDYLLRNTIELNISKPLQLKNIGFTLDSTADIQNLYKEAFVNSSTIRKERLLYGLKKAQVEISKRARLPIIDLHSAIFYEYKQDFSTTPHQKAKGLNYSVAVNMKIPLIGAETQKEYKERAKVEALKQKSRLLDTIKKSAQQIFKLYNENKRLQKHLKIVQEQIALMHKKLQIVRKRYLDGLSLYRDFNDALKNYLSYIEEKARIKRAMIINSAQLLIFIGHQLTNGQD